MIKEPIRAFVSEANFALGFPGTIRLEMGITVEEKSGKSWFVPFVVEDKNWHFENSGVMTYKTKDSEYHEEKSKYTMLNDVCNNQSSKIYELTEKEKEEIKNMIFSMCEGEIVYYRSVVEENMFKFCSQDFNELPEVEQERVFEYFA